VLERGRAHFLHSGPLPGDRYFKALEKFKAGVETPPRKVGRVIPLFISSENLLGILLWG